MTIEPLYLYLDSILKMRHTSKTSITADTFDTSNAERMSLKSGFPYLSSDTQVSSQLNTESHDESAILEKTTKMEDCEDISANELSLQRTSRYSVRTPSEIRSRNLDDGGKRQRFTGQSSTERRVSIQQVTMRQVQVPNGFAVFEDPEHMYLSLRERGLEKMFRLLKEFVKPAKYKKHSLSNYKIVKYLGGGASGMAMVARRKYPRFSRSGAVGKTVVLKACPLSGDTFSALKNTRVYIEANTLQKIQGHPNIISLYNCFVEKNIMFMELEYLSGGDLHQALHRDLGNYLPSQKSIISIAMQLFRALRDLHILGISHRDIKLENIICDRPASEWIVDTLNVKLIDFGFAHDAQHNVKSSTVLGTGAYCPPEIFLQESYMPKKVDIYQVGVVMYELLTGNTPLANKGLDLMEAMYRNGAKPRFDSPHLQNLTVGLVDLVKKCLDFNPSKRPSASEALIELREIETTRLHW